MTTHKKPTKPVSKTTRKSTSKKPPQKALKLTKSVNSSENIPFPSNLSFADIAPPDGFRAVSISQAIMEYAGPLMDMAPEPEDIVKINEVVQIATTIWNYTLNDTLKKKDKESKVDILALMQKALGLDVGKSNDLLSTMVERKHYLFPSDIQPKASPLMFMRKTVSYLIKRFNYEDLEFCAESIPANTLDLKILKSLEKLDQLILKSSNYDKYEKLFLKVQEECPERFYAWLGDKRIEEHQDTFTYFSDVYITFLYGYSHEEPVTLKSGPGKYFVEFMIEFVLRKSSVEPWEYTLCPAAIKLFYKFLYEKGYLVDRPDIMTDFIDRVEPHFLGILKERFS